MPRVAGALLSKVVGSRVHLPSLSRYQVLGSESNYPVIVNSKEEEDKLPMGTWIASPDGRAIERKGYPETFRLK